VRPRLRLERLPVVVVEVANGRGVAAFEHEDSVLLVDREEELGPPAMRRARHTCPPQTLVLPLLHAPLTFALALLSFALAACLGPRTRAQSVSMHTLRPTHTHAQAMQR
jgi:hypothetical protein